MVVSIVTSFLFFIVLPFVFGYMWKNVIREGGVIFVYLSGFFSLLAIFEVLGPAMIVMSLPTSTQTVVESVVLLVGTIAVLILRKDKVRDGIRRNIARETSGNLKRYYSSLSQVEKIYLGSFLLLLLVQVAFAAFYDIGVWRSDDYLYTVISSSAIYDNKYFVTDFTSGNYITEEMAKYIFCGIYSFYTYASSVTGLNVSIIEHTICAILYLLMAYGAFYMVSKVLFSERDDRRKRLLFLVFLSLIFLVGLYSHYSVTFRLFGVIWQGKAFLVVVVIPFLLAVYSQLLEGTIGYKQMLFCIMLSLAAISLTMMGIIVMVVIPGAMTLLHAIRTKSLRSVPLLIASELSPAAIMAAYLFYK